MHVMKFVPMLDLMKKAIAGNYAVPAFCVWNAETMLTVLDVAGKLSAPVILMNGPGEFPLLSPSVAGKIAYSLPDKFSIQAALHLDHGNSIEQVNECLASRYTSVMLDFSNKPYDENAGALREVVKMARSYNATVEGEIGSVGKVDSSSAETGTSSTLTDPDEAHAYVKETGIDVLAISIGNAHGNYTKLPRLNFDLLENIYSKVQIPLVLHGGSGTPDADIKKAIAAGIAKVNVASELIQAVRESLRKQWNAGKNTWTPAALAEAMKEMATVVEKWIIRVGAAGKS